MEYDNTNRGALFTNERKTSDKHPAYRGSINVGGKEYWLSAWIKTGKSGAKFMSLSIQSKEAYVEAKKAPKPASSVGIDDDDFVPF